MLGLRYLCRLALRLEVYLYVDNTKKNYFFNISNLQGTMKGLLPDQLESLDCEIILGNTYHLGNRPGTEVLKKAGGLHKFMAWNRALLTDSGGFQMVSLLKLAEITEEGVKFKSPYDNSEIMLTPEKSIEIQNCIGRVLIYLLQFYASEIGLFSYLVISNQLVMCNCHRC